MQRLVPLLQETLEIRGTAYALRLRRRQPTPSGMAVLRALKNGALSPEEAASRINQLLPRVRSGLRELRNAGLVEEVEGRYRLSKSGARFVE